MSKASLFSKIKSVHPNRRDWNKARADRIRDYRENVYDAMWDELDEADKWKATDEKWDDAKLPAWKILKKYPNERNMLDEWNRPTNK